MYLEPEQLEILTGFKLKRFQCRELMKQGIPFIKRHDGFPVVHMDDARPGLGNQNRIKQHEEKPNFEGL